MIQRSPWKEKLSKWLNKVIKDSICIVCINNLYSILIPGRSLGHIEKQSVCVKWWKHKQSTNLYEELDEWLFVRDLSQRHDATKNSYVKQTKTTKGCVRWTFTITRGMCMDRERDHRWTSQGCPAEGILGRLPDFDSDLQECQCAGCTMPRRWCVHDWRLLECLVWVRAQEAGPDCTQASQSEEREECTRVGGAHPPSYIYIPTAKMKAQGLK